MRFIEFARLFLYIHEVTGNHGLRVNAIQKWCGGQDGDSWCCEFATMLLDIWFQGKSPIPRLAACQAVYDLAKRNNWLTDIPTEGDLVLYVNDADHAHHIGFYTFGQNPMIHSPSILSGNTSPDGKSDNGDGVHEHPITVAPEHVRFVRYPRCPVTTAQAGQ